MRGAPAEAAARERDERGAPAEVAARDREGRETPKSEKGREEDDNFLGPMGREGKTFGETSESSEVIGVGGSQRVGGRWRMRRG